MILIATTVTAIVSMMTVITMNVETTMITITIMVTMTILEMKIMIITLIIAQCRYRHRSHILVPPNDTPPTQTILCH